MLCQKKKMVIYCLLLFLLVGSSNRMIAGDKFKRKCKSKDRDPSTPKYKIGLVLNPEDSDPPVSTLIQVGIEAKYINREDLTKLAKAFKQDFCKEEVLIVVLLTSNRVINLFPLRDGPGYPEFEQANRGVYYLDRRSGEEYISYSTVPNYNQNEQARVRIDFGIVKKKPDQQQQ